MEWFADLKTECLVNVKIYSFSENLTVKGLLKQIHCDWSSQELRVFIMGSFPQDRYPTSSIHYIVKPVKGLVASVYV